MFVCNNDKLLFSPINKRMIESLLLDFQRAYLNRSSSSIGIESFSREGKYSGSLTTGFVFRGILIIMTSVIFMLLVVGSSLFGTDSEFRKSVGISSCDKLSEFFSNQTSQIKGIACICSGNQSSDKMMWNIIKIRRREEMSKRKRIELCWVTRVDQSDGETNYLNSIQWSLQSVTWRTHTRLSHHCDFYIRSQQGRGRKKERIEERKEGSKNEIRYVYIYIYIYILWKWGEKDTKEI